MSRNTKPLSPVELKNVANIYAKGKAGKVLTERETRLLERYEEIRDKPTAKEPPKEKKKVGRPRKELSPEQKKSITFSLSIGASVEEVAAHIGVSRQTIYRNFVTLIKNGAAGFRCNLRRWQAIKAKKGDTGMLIWLGKQCLGQKDHQEIAEKVYPPFEIRILSPEESKPPLEISNDSES